MKKISLNSIVKISIIISLLVISCAVSFYFFNYLPKKQAYAECLASYPNDWSESTDVKFLFIPSGLCQREYTFSRFTDLLTSKVKEVALEFKDQNKDISSEEVKNEIKTEAFKRVKNEINK